MSDVKIESFPLLFPIPSDQKKKSSVPVKERVAICAPQIPQPSRTISPVPSRNNIKTMHGQLLTPAPGRLTPTGQGRIKAPPVCVDRALKKVASSMVELNMAGVCFPTEEAESCAGKALLLDGKFNLNCQEEFPLNIEESDSVSFLKSSLSTASAVSSEGSEAQFVSSNSTVITTSSVGSARGLSVMGNDRAANPPAAVKTDPPLKVVQTLSSSFTDNLVKENSSRQGRSLQRWLVHSPTEQLVRQVAGTIPITRDGRIILASASRKTEWILPKGGWDADETKEECAARETYEEAGLLGRLGGCLEPIDYETSKARKRRLSNLSSSGLEGCTMVKKTKREEDEMRPPPSERAEKDKLMASVSVGSDFISSSIRKSGSPESTCSGGESGVNNTTASSTGAATTSFDPKNYSYVRLLLFPLYVTSVKSDWPEKGRLRKMVDIDEAIKIMEAENRLYFKRGLEMVKERRLHLLKP